MVNIRKKSRLIIIAVVVIVVLVVAIPYAAYALPADDSNIAANKTLLAKGIAREVRNGEIITSSANFTLTLERATSNNTVLRFNVVDGSIDVNGATYTIASGEGGVLRGRHLILLKAEGTGPDGQAITLKLVGRYSWMGGRLYVVRIGARLLTNNGNFTLLMRAAIRV
ncbi:MAG TPA: hypothetical protein VK209_12665 [Candidatus Sulfotelmatobacter sp.]|nr:hypothetical protein [Candidatus Sulfotelmatobacter sp.]